MKIFGNRGLSPNVPQLTLRSSLQVAIRVARQHITPWLLISYALFIGGLVYANFIADAFIKFLLMAGVGIYILIYLPISFLLKPSWLRFFASIVPAILWLAVGAISTSSKFEYWVRADEFERDIHAAKVRDNNLEFVRWKSWNYTFDSWKDYFYVADDRREFDLNGDTCAGGEVKKLRPHFYTVECDLNKPMRNTK